MKGFLDIHEVVLPQNCLNIAFAQLRLAGSRREEGVALLLGHRRENIFEVTETYEPAHVASKVEDGLYYAIDSEALYQLNKKLYEGKQKLFAQIHSHPEEAYHSVADDIFAVVTTVGGLSVVVPNFATGPVSLSNCAIFRLSEQNKWLELSQHEVAQFIKII